MSPPTRHARTAAALVAALLVASTGMLTGGLSAVTAAPSSASDLPRHVLDAQTASDGSHVHAVGPATCPKGQFRAEYFNNMTFTGTSTLVRCESPPINHDWGTTGPGNGISATRFSVRSTGTFDFPAGNTTFTTTADDGIRLWVDGAPLINEWRDQPAKTVTATRSLTAGAHTVKVEYYQNAYGAMEKVSWQSAGAATSTPAATATSTPGATGTPSATKTPTPPTATATATPPPTGGEAPVAGQTCPAWVHDQYVTTGPDGRTYPTWHPPTDPKSGCHFRHEHGNDPSLFEAGFRPPFHYADVTEDGTITENHWGTKVYVLQDAGFNGYRWMIVHHMGTTGTGRACQRFHETGVYVKRLSDNKRVAELHFMGDHGPARALQADGNGVLLTPPECPSQGHEAVADGSTGVRQIPHGASPGSITGYEPWGIDNRRVKPTLGLDLGIGVNAPSLIDACATVPACDRATRRGDDGSMRFLTYVGYGLRAPAGIGSNGVFWTDALGRTTKTAGSAGAVRQFMEPGLNAPIKSRADDEECYYVGKPRSGGGFDDSLAWQMPMSCGRDDVQPTGAHIGTGHNLQAPN